MRFVPVLVLLAHGAVVTSAAAQSGKTQNLDINSDPLPKGVVARLGTLRFQPAGDAVGADPFEAVLRQFSAPVAIALSPDGTAVATIHPDLKKRVQPIQASDASIVARLIVQLDSQTYAEREKARIALEQMGEGATHLLKQALEGKVTVELRLRLEALLRKCEATSTDSMQHHRSVATLE